MNINVMLKVHHQCHSPRGAPMGRSDWRCDPEAKLKVRLQKLRMVDGAYDAGGAYWGGWSPEHGGMWCAFDQEGDGEDAMRMFIRAKTREDAKAEVLEEYPNAKFYR